jgi:hypothetical protein
LDTNTDFRESFEDARNELILSMKNQGAESQQARHRAFLLQDEESSDMEDLGKSHNASPAQ